MAQKCETAEVSTFPLFLKMESNLSAEFKTNKNHSSNCMHFAENLASVIFFTFLQPNVPLFTDEYLTIL